MHEDTLQDLSTLKPFYGPLSEPPRDAFGFYAWYVLGARAAPPQRDAALAALKHIPAFTPDSIWKAPRAKLQAAVALTGPFEERLRTLISGVEVFRYYRDIGDRLRGPLRDARRAVRLLEGLDRGGAHWMLLVAGDQPIVPRHPGVTRVLTRLDVVRASPGVAADRLAARALSSLVADLPRLKSTVHHLAHHAQVTCTPGDPHCRVCPLAPHCPHGARVGSTGA